MSCKFWISLISISTIIIFFIWYFCYNLKLHRISGPAVERSNGEKEWWENGATHRIDGPACVSGDGKRKAWYLRGVLLREESVFSWGTCINIRGEGSHWVKLSDKNNWQINI